MTGGSGFNDFLRSVFKLETAAAAAQNVNANVNFQVPIAKPFSRIFHAGIFGCIVLYKS